MHRLKRLSKRFVQRIIKITLKSAPFSVLKFVERESRLALGKGWGTGTVSAEVRDCFDQLPVTSRIQPVVLDIGANVGNWTAALLAIAPDATVYAFEPSTVAHAELSKRFSKNPNVHIVKAAVGAKSGTANLWADKEGSGLASLTQRKLDHFGIDMNHSESVDVVTLDSWCKENSVYPELIKIDVEGHEMDVLQGGEKTISTTNVVQFEFGGCNIDTRTYFQDFFYLFENSGFEIKRITPRGLLSVPRYREEDEAFQTTNYLAVRKTKRYAQAEQNFIEEWNLDDDFFNGVQLGDLKWHRDKYRLIFNRERNDSSTTSQIDAIEMTGRLRFGNSYISLLQALNVAKAIGADTIVANHSHMKPETDSVIDGIKITTKKVKGQNVLRGQFYYPNLLTNFFDEAGVRHWSCSPYKALPELFEIYELGLKQEPLDGDEIVVHLRAGDVFEKPNPHPLYGQPPLSFYLKVLEEKSWSRVWLVFQNDANPVIPELIRMLEERKIPFQTVSGDFVSDVELCLRTQNLVMSNGTFLFPVVCASKNLRTIYKFESQHKPFPICFEENIFEIKHYRDEFGDYNAKVMREWMNTAEQREMMLKYPARHLEHQVIYSSAAHNG